MESTLRAALLNYRAVAANAMNLANPELAKEEALGKFMDLAVEKVEALEAAAGIVEEAKPVDTDAILKAEGAVEVPANLAESILIPSTPAAEDAHGEDDASQPSANPQ